MTAEKNIYTYDADGNQTQVDVIIGSVAAPTRVISRKTMTYDLFNRQLSWTLSKPDGQGYEPYGQINWTTEKSESNTYRGDRWQRTATTVGGVTTTYLYDGDNVIADIVDGRVVRTYVTPMLDQNVSMTVVGDTPVSYFYNADERQSVRNLTDTTGTVVQSYDYTAFGDKIDSLTSGSVEQRYTYTGRESSEVSGDYYFRYRMYGAGLGGFLSRDPLGYVDSETLYSVSFAARLGMDPMGLYEIIWNGSWTTAEKAMVTDSFGRVKARSEAILKQIKDRIKAIKAEAGDDCCGCYDSLLDDLNKLNAAVKSLVKQLKSNSLNLVLKQVSDPSSFSASVVIHPYNPLTDDIMKINTLPPQ